MSNLGDVKAWLHDRLPDLLARHHVPAAAISLSAEGRVVEHAYGVLNKATGVSATSDSIFQIGSVTKLLTATLTMQLVDEGLLGIDTRVRSCLPDFTLLDETAAADLTIRQLLCHTGGFEGDVLTDTGKNDDAVERLVNSLSSTPQLFRPGHGFSYNNAGFCILGRIVEVMRNESFDRCLRRYLVDPLGLTHVATDPYEAIMHRTAIGHVTPPRGGEPEPATIWSPGRSNAPAGCMLAMRARDLLEFARLHLNSGRASDGTTILRAESVQAMQRRQVELPDIPMPADAWGLGWMIFDWEGGPVIGHSGSTVGQASHLWVVPGTDVALVMLTNGGNSTGAFRETAGHLLRELAAVTIPKALTPPAQRETINAARFVGRYESTVMSSEVTQDGSGRVWLDRTARGGMELVDGGRYRCELVPFRQDMLITADPVHGEHVAYSFLDDDGSGRALFLHGGRADRRVET